MRPMSFFAKLLATCHIVGASKEHRNTNSGNRKSKQKNKFVNFDNRKLQRSTTNICVCICSKKRSRTEPMQDMASPSGPCKETFKRETIHA
jgi:hypothetical protein